MEEGRVQLVKRGWNDGFTLIEVIIVVLILGILGSVSILGIQAATRQNPQKAAEKLSAQLDLVREQSLAMISDSLSLRLHCKSDGSYEVITIQTSIDGTGLSTETVLDSKVLCSSAVQISYEQAGTFHTISAGTFIDFKFSKQSGAFTVTFTKLKFTGSCEVSLRLVTATGRNYIGKE